MKKIENVPCETQVLVCTNDRPGDKPCCARYGGQDFFHRLKSKMKETGLSKSIWVTRTGCLGYCNDKGTTVAIQKDGHPKRWFTEVTSEDYEKVWNEATLK